jgi:hypothetical protein
MTNLHNAQTSNTVLADALHGAVAGSSVLDEVECWLLAETANFGRLAVRAYEGVNIFPVNFLIKGKTVFFRSGPGSKLADIHQWPVVAFETDGVEGSRRWSVVIRGVASRMGSDTEIIESGVLDLTPYAPGEKFNYVRIDASSISGREFPRL